MTIPKNVVNIYGFVDKFCFIFSLGIDYQTLRDELLAGSRLPSPTHSTPKISHLIQTCWLGDPIERPTFTKIKEELHQSCDVLSSRSSLEAKPSQYLTLLSDDSMRKQYNLIQECNPMYGRNDDQTEKGDDDNGGSAVIVYNTTSPSLLYPYLQIPSTSEATELGTCLNSTSTQEVDLLNYVDTSNGYTGLEYEDEPFLFGTNKDDNNEEVFLNQLEVDHYNYLQKERRLSKEATTVAQSPSIV